MSNVHTIESIIHEEDQEINKFIDDTHKMMAVFGKENKQLKNDRDGLMYALEHEKKHVSELKTTLNDLNQSYMIVEDKLKRQTERETTMKQPLIGASKSMTGLLEEYEKQMKQETPLDVKKEYLKYCSQKEDLSIYKKQIKTQCQDDKMKKTNKSNKK